MPSSSQISTDTIRCINASHNDLCNIHLSWILPTARTYICVNENYWVQQRFNDFFQSVMWVETQQNQKQVEQVK